MLIIKKVDILILGKGPTQRLDNTKLTAGKEAATNFSEQHKTFYLRWHYDGTNNYLFPNDIEI